MQAFESLQAVPFGTLGFEHRPVTVLQVPAMWHWSEAVQTTGFAPTHVPFWQESVWVQALESLQEVPFGALGFEQRPVAGMQVPAT